MTETIVAYQCPNCGAGLSFDAEKQCFACEFCLSEFTEEEIKRQDPEEARQQREDDDRAFNEGMNEYTCPNCGASVVADVNTAATHCYYCHNPVVLVGRLAGQMKPSRVVPFAYNRDAAKNKFLKFAKSKWFVPNGFYSSGQVDKIQGIYYPFWVTDADTFSEMDANATRVRVWRVGNVEYTETSKFRVERKGNIHFEDITSSAFSQADKKMLEGVLPYPSEALKEFSMPYLSGYIAKKRDIEREALSGEVKARMQNYASTLLRNTVDGYNTVSPERVQVNIQKSHWEYALMPLWVLTYKSKKGKIYTYAMNGHTGKVYGELPLSPWKLIALAAAIMAVAFPVFYWLGGLL